MVIKSHGRRCGGCCGVIGVGRYGGVGVGRLGRDGGGRGAVDEGVEVMGLG